MKIKKLQVKNFKKFKDIEVIFDDLDCLVGSNNSGKSTLLQAIALFDFCLHQCLSKTNGKTITLKNRSVKEENFDVLPIIKGTDLWFDRTTQAKNKHILIEITVIFDNEKVVSTTLDYSFNLFKIGTKTDLDVVWLTELQNFKASYLPVFSSFHTQEEKRTSLAIRNDLAKGNVNAVIRNLLLTLKEQGREKALVDIMQNAFPSIKKLSIEFDEASTQYIDVSYLEEGYKKTFDIFSAGSGFQQFLYLFGFILLENPSIILLDEPDVHLHGQLQKSLLEELKKLAEAGQQVIFATHSRDLITHLQPENILSLHEGQATRLELDYEIFNTLENLGSMENTQLVVLQEFKRVLVVENREDWDFIKIFGEKVLGEQKMRLIERRLAVLYAEGNPSKQDMVKFQASLQQMFIKQGKTIKMLVVCDRDYHPELTELSKKLQKKNEHIAWHVWERNEIENYLLSLTALGKLAKPKKQAPNTQQVQPSFAPDKTFLDNLEDTFWKCIDIQRDDVEDQFMKTFEEYYNGKDKKMGWDISTISKKVREYMNTHWEQNKIRLADSKKVISHISGWFQSQKLASFSANMLAEKLEASDLPPEIHEFCERLGEFAGVS